MTVVVCKTPSQFPDQLVSRSEFSILLLAQRTTYSRRSILGDAGFSTVF